MEFNNQSEIKCNAYGNCVVFKPAELVPGSAHKLTEIIANSGLPKGVFNLVMGKGSEVGEVLTNSPLVNAISFTGSQKVGRQVAVNAAKNLTKLQLEMGGKNPQIILDDAEGFQHNECLILKIFP